MQTFKDFSTYILEHAKHNRASSRNYLHIILNNKNLPWDDYAEYMATITWWTGIPFGKGGSKAIGVIFAEDLDEALVQADNYDYCIISSIGSFYYSEWSGNIFHAFDKFIESEAPCRGHLLFHPHHAYGTLHKQTMFLNLKHWRKIGRPSFKPFSGEVINYVRSKQNIHHDYTPLWVAPGKGKKIVWFAPQAEYISKVLEDGKTIYNFDHERRFKFYTYPERKYCQALEDEVAKTSNIIYTINNERMPKIGFWYKNKKIKKFDTIYCPASGRMAEYLWKEVGNEDTQLVIYDNNKDSLQWKKLIYDMASTPDDIRKINNHFINKGTCVIDDGGYKPKTVQYNDDKFSTEEFLAITKKIKPKFVLCDIVFDRLEISEKGNKLLHVSNIFSYHPLIHKMKIKNIHDKLLSYAEIPHLTITGCNIFKDAYIHESS